MTKFLLLYFSSNSTMFTFGRWQLKAKHRKINLKQMYFHHSFIFGKLEGQYALFSSPQCRLIFDSLKWAFFLYVDLTLFFGFYMYELSIRHILSSFSFDMLSIFKILWRVKLLCFNIHSTIMSLPSILSFS